MSAKSKLKNCLDELDLVNRAYAMLSTGTKSDIDERKPRVAKLISRKIVLKRRARVLVDEYCEYIKGEK